MVGIFYFVSMKQIVVLLFLFSFLSCSTGSESTNNETNMNDNTEEVSAEDLIKRDQERADSLKKELNLK
jgi:hypothetical protein